MYLFYNYCVLWTAIYLFNRIMYVMFQLRPFTVHNVFPCFYGPNKVIIIIIIIMATKNPNVAISLFIIAISQLFKL